MGRKHILDYSIMPCYTGFKEEMRRILLGLCLFAVGSRGDSHAFNKNGSKIAAAAKTALLTNLADGLLRFSKQAACLTNPALPNVFQRRHLQIFPEESKAGTAADMRLSRQSVHR